MACKAVAMSTLFLFPGSEREYFRSWVLSHNNVCFHVFAEWIVVIVLLTDKSGPVGSNLNVNGLYV